MPSAARLAHRTILRAVEASLTGYHSVKTRSGVFTPKDPLILSELCWGSERNDLLTTRLRMNGRRRHAAFGFNGPVRAVNSHSEMGKNGNHIPCLFMSPAEVLFTQYWVPVEERVSHLMHELAQAKSASKGSEGTDPQALMQAYPRSFARGRSRILCTPLA
jgi:hypothetical protein